MRFVVGDCVRPLCGMYSATTNKLQTGHVVLTHNPCDPGPGPHMITSNKHVCIRIVTLWDRNIVTPVVGSVTSRFPLS